MRTDYFLILLIFKSIHGLGPNYLCDLVTFQIDVNMCVTRAHRLNVHFPPSHCVLEGRSLVNSGGHLWNDLSATLKDINSVNSFKVALKRHLLSSQ